MKRYFSVTKWLFTAVAVVALFAGMHDFFLVFFAVSAAYDIAAKFK